jgi:hypothetical protein
VAKSSEEKEEKEMTHNDDLEALKREICDYLSYGKQDKSEKYAVGAAIEYLHSRNMLVGKGYVAVPLEPTHEMLEEMVRGVCGPINSGKYESPWNKAEENYKAMIQAAQKKEGG